MLKMPKFNTIEELKLYIEKNEVLKNYYPELKKSINEFPETIRYKHSNSVKKIKLFIFIKRICGKYYLIWRFKQYLKS